jgi:hypothetical protein
LIKLIILLLDAVLAFSAKQENIEKLFLAAITGREREEKKHNKRQAVLYSIPFGMLAREWNIDESPNVLRAQFGSTQRAIK